MLLHKNSTHLSVSFAFYSQYALIFFKPASKITCRYQPWAYQFLNENGLILRKSHISRALEINRIRVDDKTEWGYKHAQLVTESCKF